MGLYILTLQEMQGGCRQQWRCINGILVGLRHKATLPHAAITGVYIHGLTPGDEALQTQSMESLIASDIIEHLGFAKSHIKFMKDKKHSDTNRRRHKCKSGIKNI